MTEGDSTAPSRPALLGAGFVVALIALQAQLARSGAADEIALGAATATTAHFRGVPISAHRVSSFAAVYPPGSDRKEALWIGNSQLFSMTTAADGESHPANEIASTRLGFPVYALALPNANPTEQLCVVAWALSRRAPSILVVPVMFSDLREEGLRDDLSDLLTSEAAALLNERPIGKGIVADLRQRHSDTTSVTLTARTTADKSEAILTSALSSRWELWRRRGDVSARSLEDLRHLRNYAFGIKRESKRKLVPATLARHMAALEEIFSLAHERGAHVFVYVTPVRHDVEPPYVMHQYEAWKSDLKTLVEAHGEMYEDLDTLLPGEDFAKKAGDLDFKHFNANGHAILGARVADRLVGLVEGEAP